MNKIDKILKENGDKLSEDEILKYKIKKVEKLLRSYKENLSESKILTYRLSLQAVRYDKENVQTSNKSDLSDVAAAREERLKKINEEIFYTESMLDTLSPKERYVIEGFYINKLPLIKIAAKIGYTSEKGTWKFKGKIINQLVDFLENII